MKVQKHIVSDSVPPPTEGLDDLFDPAADVDMMPVQSDTDPDRRTDGQDPVVREDTETATDIYWTVEQAAKELQVSERTIRRWCTGGELDAQQVRGLRSLEWRIKPVSKPEIDRLKESRRTEEPTREPEADKADGVLKQLVEMLADKDRKLEETREQLQQSQQMLLQACLSLQQREEQLKLLTAQNDKPGWLQRLLGAVTGRKKY